LLCQILWVFFCETQQKRLAIWVLLCQYGFMYPRQKMIKQDGNVYRYVDIVEGYRREGGKVGQKIVAKLGPMSEQAFKNLQAAFRASRCGKSVIVPEKVTGEIIGHDKVRQNLHYLDICVAKEMWDYWNLDKLFMDIIGMEERKIFSGTIIQILTIQRCVNPRSKLYAQEWFPTTALPELLSIQLRSFNNVRVHRALETLYNCTPRLQEKLPALYLKQQPQFAALFLDVTNTYFAGHGCEKAERNRTKEGIRNKYCIGIVLLANEQGYPLRWAVVPGKTKDHNAMADMIDTLKNIEWTANTPLVCDRAMGQQKSLYHLCASGIQFITAAHVDAIESFTKDIAWTLFSDLTIDSQSDSRDNDIANVIQLAENSNVFEKIDEHLFVMDLGSVTVLEDDAGTEHKRKGIQCRLEEARQLHARLESGVFKTIKELALDIGLSPARVSQLLKPYLKLDDKVQEFILAMPSDFYVTGSQLEYLLKAKDPENQLDRLREIMSHAQSCDPDNDEDPCSQPLQLRLVAYFNPQMFVDQRQRTAEHLEDLEKFISGFNAELAEAKRTRKEEPTQRRIFQQLDKHNWRDLFDVTFESIPIRDGKGYTFRCTLTCKEDAWKKRHRYNGFVLLLVQKDLKKTSREIAMLYRQKDMVEKDFQCIKSVVKLRPVYHRTDEKVEAHVTLCMLSLLLERILENRLEAEGIRKTAARALDELATCHLNLMVPAAGVGQCFYSVTEATRGQTDILRVLNLERYVDDTAVSRRLLPRIDTT